jgi:hypothetical protein
MAGVLTIDQWLGGPDGVKVESTFPSSSKTYMYDFGQNISGWTFELEYQTVVVDTISYDRITNAPSFSNSSVIGYFPSGVVSTSTYINVTNSVTGIVNVTHPANLYTGNILPDARAATPLLVVGLTWKDTQSPPQINSHRVAKILAWEPLVTPGSPTSSTGYVSLI